MANDGKLTKAELAFLQKLDERSAPEKFKEGLKFLESELSIKVVPDSSASETCYLQVYTKATMEELAGINMGPDFKYYRKINSKEYEGLVDSWNEAMSTLDLDAALFWYPLLSTDTKNKPEIENYISRMLKLDAKFNEQHGYTIGYKRNILINPENCPNGETPRAFIPGDDNLSDVLNGVKPDHVLTLFPEAERKQLMLFLGRTLCGRDRSIPIDEDLDILDHKYRKMSIIYGSEPGTGKSTLCSHMIKTMQYLGYDVSTFRGIGEKFNMGSIYLSDFAFKDDSVKSGVDKILQSEDIKSIITGSQVRTEDKGRDAFNVSPMCSVLFITNEFNHDQLFNKDAGVIDRLSILYTHTSSELRSIQESSEDPLIKNSPDLRPHAHLPWLAKELGVSVEALWCKIFRLSVDYFLEHMKKGTLEKEISYLTSYQRFPISHSALENVVSAMHVSALCCSDPEHYVNKALFPLNNKASMQWIVDKYSFVQSDPRAHVVRNIIKQDWINKNRPPTHPWIGIKLVTATSLKRMVNLLEKETNNPNSSLDELIKKSFGELSTADGIYIGSGRSYVKRAWSKCVSPSGSRSLIKLANEVHSTIKEDSRLDKTYQVMLENPNANLTHVEIAGFNPQLMADYLEKVYTETPKGNSIDFLTSMKQLYKKGGKA